MNGSLKIQIIDAVRTILVLLLLVTAVAGLALFLTLLISPLLLRVPDHFLHLSKALVLRDYGHLLLYLILPWHQSPLTLAGIPMTDNAVAHFSDVRHLIIMTLWMTIVALIGAGLALRYEKRTWQLWKLSGPLKSLLALLIIVGLLAIADFDDFFIRFHYLAFSNMNWVFSATDNPIINLFPDTFFATLFGIWWLFTILFLALIQWCINRYLRRLIRKF